MAVPPYATARQRVDAVGGNTLLLRWVVEGGTSTAVALAVAGAPGAEVVSAATVSLGVLPLVCPRRLLDAVPDVAAVLVRAAHRLTEPTVEINEAVVGLLTCLLIALKMVGLVDPPTLRRLPGVAGTLASVYATLPSGGAAGRGAAGAAATLHEVFKILAAAPEALAASPGGLALLVKWARQTGTPHQQWLADTAVAIALFVGVYHLLAAGAGVDGAPTTLPSTLRRAGATWAHVAITHPSRKAAAAGRLLALLATHGAGMVGEVLADAPWAGDFPNPALSIFGDDANGHCWACGAPRRADAPPDTAGDSLGPSLRSCAGCRVAAYCSAACATAGWRTAGGGHKAACRRWAAYRRVTVPELVAARAASPTRGGGVSTRAALFPITSIRHGGFSGPPGSWPWHSGAAVRIEEAGLHLADMVVIADPGSLSIAMVPAPEYVHWPSAVAAAALAAPLAAHGGRVLRVIMREHPPTVRGYGFLMDGGSIQLCPCAENGCTSGNGDDA